MKKVLLILVIALVVSSVGYAEWRSDIGLGIPWKLGATLTSALGENEDLNILEEFTFLVPQIFVGYEFGVGPVNLGVGGRLYTLILESVLMPAAFAELDIGPVAVNLNLAGGAFALFGLFNEFSTRELFLPDLSAHLKVGRALQLGVGVTGILHPDIPDDILPYVLYLSGKFVVRF